ncbi:hypothetical protein [Mycobacterium sp. AZCC_0083]|uniref:hypothetical protein n=1 Tax=Mycobacterium sp. AZCC_0083 TaxID=2735882 RepID=UPI001621CDED|nr:hypothetical protein [Mycobacterium sp. AZCC_0083]MBB5167591.1 hypothetical protein [Mycobacterium sp. AZCC_0083]
MQSLRIVNCPGNVQSPGPWHTNATPDRSTGTLVCGLRGGMPTVAWTRDDEQLVSVAEAAQHGSTLEDLYRWWSAQS